MIGGFLVCLVFLLSFRAIGFNEKKRPSENMGKLMKEDGWYILGVTLIVILLFIII